MGGRGSSRDREYYRDRHGKFARYGEEYTTLLQCKNIKFVTTSNKTDSVTPPRETRTEGRVYVTVGRNNKLKCITFYSKDGRKRIQIDLDHMHKGKNPHKHIGYNHGKDGIISSSDRKLIDKVKKLWQKECEK